MTPQSTFMIVAPVASGRAAALRQLLAGMNVGPGIADPHNALVPFARFPGLHVARFVVVEDATLDDVRTYGVDPPDGAPFLVFLGDHDGPAARMLDELATIAGPGLRRIFGHCRDFSDATDLRGWMRKRETPSAAQYTNWVGRTVRQIQEEAALRAALAQAIDSGSGGGSGSGSDSASDSDSRAGGAAAELPRALFERLRTAIAGQGLTLTSPAPTPLDWRVRKAAHLSGGLLLAAVAAPFLIVMAPFLIWYLRRLEKSDPVIAPALDPAHVRTLEAVEDQGVTNGFSVVGGIKPGRFRKVLMSAALWALNFTMRHIYVRGRLARVGTIHFARWVFIDDRRRMVFASNYDGREEAYMDDFINKAGFGLNLVFSSAIGYPRTAFLVSGGASDEQVFKRVLRRHQIPNDVWYKAYPGLTAADLYRNTQVRVGFERDGMSDAEIRTWLELI